MFFLQDCRKQKEKYHHHHYHYYNKQELKKLCITYKKWDQTLSKNKWLNRERVITFRKTLRGKHKPRQQQEESAKQKQESE